MRPREERGRTVRTSLYTCPAAVLFPSRARGDRGLFSGTASVRTVSSPSTTRTRGNKEVQPICISPGTAEKVVSKSHQIYSERIFIISLGLFCPGTAVYTTWEEILEYHWLPWLTGMTLPVESSLLRDSSQLRARTKCSVQKGKFVKSTNQTLGRIHNPSYPTHSSLCDEGCPASCRYMNFTRWNYLI